MENNKDFKTRMREYAMEKEKNNQVNVEKEMTIMILED